MKYTKYKTLYRLSLFLLFLVAAGTFAFGAELSAADKQFLDGYEKIRVALVADDLPAARQAAAALNDEGAALAKSESLTDARKAFEALSDKAIKISADQPGYYIMHCSMLKKDWVQTSKKVGNPYGGKEMPTCGQIKKK